MALRVMIVATMLVTTTAVILSAADDVSGGGSGSVLLRRLGIDAISLLVVAVIWNELSPLLEAVWAAQDKCSSSNASQDSYSAWMQVLEQYAVFGAECGAWMEKAGKQ
mmetsp:Transcript_110884/g.254122  ORF Transcript_110884/g.254122 Transcript_110884/m.254122 type:complete len:108 (-) Transcript_110884:669-992(-)